MIIIGITPEKILPDEPRLWAEALENGVALLHLRKPDAPVEESNLDTYIHFVRKRLQQVGSHATIETVRGIGYCIK